MNIRQLRFVSAVASTNSFVKAAEFCNVTQPTLSNAIARLETEFENRIFDRSTRSVSLSPFGRHILPTIDRAISDIDEVVAASQSWRNPTHKLVRLGLSPVVDMRVLQKILAPFKDANPDVKFFYKECYFGDLDQRLLQGQLDLAVMPPCKLKSHQPKIEIYNEPLFYLPCNNGAGNKTFSSVSLPDIADENLILTIDSCGLRGVTLDLFKQNNLELNEYPGQATSYSVVEEWAEIGIGAGILPQSKLSTTNTRACPLTLESGQSARVYSAVFWNASSTGQSHIRALLEHMQTMAATNIAD